jgi:hypothetical protein
MLETDMPIDVQISPLEKRIVASRDDLVMLFSTNEPPNAAPIPKKKMDNENAN